VFTASGSMFLSSIERRETRRYLEMFYFLKFQDLVCYLFQLLEIKGPFWGAYQGLAPIHNRECMSIVHVVVRTIFCLLVHLFVKLILQLLPMEEKTES
jgi:hypothetical protein